MASSEPVETIFPEFCPVKIARNNNNIFNNHNIMLKIIAILWLVLAYIFQTEIIGISCMQQTKLVVCGYVGA